MGNEFLEPENSVERTSTSGQDKVFQYAIILESQTKAQIRSEIQAEQGSIKVQWNRLAIQQTNYY